ncbi:hypothetical protein EJ06DRAFT_339993 [Trichodelitschia bisporula]|uniref:Cora-domain-containing protein n=1 Tax=Trichodelitschia bisporula TaxID=703511 RepID=A0A6G1I316_9PEZI|nr:hypothetical protein EJ06DRAFT_339993 [Trichodelitschia bisporula]
MRRSSVDDSDDHPQRSRRPDVREMEEVDEIERLRRAGSNLADAAPRRRRSMVEDAEAGRRRGYVQEEPIPGIGRVGSNLSAYDGAVNDRRSQRRRPRERDTAYIEEDHPYAPQYPAVSPWAAPFQGGYVGPSHHHIPEPPRQSSRDRVRDLERAHDLEIARDNVRAYDSGDDRAGREAARRELRRMEESSRNRELRYREDRVRSLQQNSSLRMYGGVAPGGPTYVAGGYYPPPPPPFPHGAMPMPPPGSPYVSPYVSPPPPPGAPMYQAQMPPPPRQPVPEIVPSDDYIEEISEETSEESDSASGSGSDVRSRDRDRSRMRRPRYHESTSYSDSDSDGSVDRAYSFTLRRHSRASVLPDSSSGSVSVHSGKSERSPSTGDVSLSPEIRWISEAQYIGEGIPGGSQSGRLAMIDEKTALALGMKKRINCLYRWVHFEDPKMDLDDLETKILRIPRVTEAEKKAISTLLRRLRHKYDRPLLTSRNSKMKYMEPCYLQETIPPETLRAPTPTKYVSWTCLPYFTLKKYQDVQSRAKASHPTRTLIEAHNSLSSREQDMKQAVCMLGTAKPEHCFHIAQLWCLVVGDSLVVSCAEIPRSVFEGTAVVTGPVKEATSATSGKEGHPDQSSSGAVLLVHRGDDQCWALPLSECQTWFAFMSHFREFFPRRGNIKYNGKTIGQTDWSKVVSAAERTQIHLYLDSWAVPKRPIRSILPEDLYPIPASKPSTPAAPSAPKEPQPQASAGAQRPSTPGPQVNTEEPRPSPPGPQVSAGQSLASTARSPLSSGESLLDDAVVQPSTEGPPPGAGDSNTAARVPQPSTEAPPPSKGDPKSTVDLPQASTGESQSTAGAPLSATGESQTPVSASKSSAEEAQSTAGVSAPSTAVPPPNVGKSQSATGSAKPDIAGATPKTGVAPPPQSKTVRIQMSGEQATFSDGAPAGGDAAARRVGAPSPLPPPMSQFPEQFQVFTWINTYPSSSEEPDEIDAPASTSNSLALPTAINDDAFKADLRDIDQYLRYRTKLSDRLVYNACPLKTRAAVYERLSAENETVSGAKDEKDEAAIFHATKVCLFNVTGAMFEFFLPFDVEAPTVQKFWGAVYQLLFGPDVTDQKDNNGDEQKSRARSTTPSKKTKSSDSDAGKIDGEGLMEVTETLERLIRRVNPFVELFSPAQTSERNAIEVSEDFYRSWPHLLMGLIYASKSDVNAEGQWENCRLLIESGANEMIQGVMQKSLSDYLVFSATDLASVLSLHMLKDHPAPGTDITEIYRNYIVQLQRNIAANPLDRRHQESISCLKQELSIIEKTLREQLRTIQHQTTQVVEERDTSGSRSRSRSYAGYVTATATGASIIPRPSIVMKGTSSSNLNIEDSAGIRGLLLQDCRSWVNARLSEFDHISDRADDLVALNLSRIDHNKDRRENAIYAFTVVTIVFLPFSTVASIFGINTADVRDMKAKQWAFWAAALPLTALVIGLTLLWTGELDRFWGGFRKLSGRRPSTSPPAGGHPGPPGPPGPSDPLFGEPPPPYPGMSPYPGMAPHSGTMGVMGLQPRPVRRVTIDPRHGGDDDFVEDDWHIEPGGRVLRRSRRY